jgi:hypothetical protein
MRIPIILCLNVIAIVKQLKVDGITCPEFDEYNVLVCMIRSISTSIISVRMFFYHVLELGLIKIKPTEHSIAKISIKS